MYADDHQFYHTGRDLPTTISKLRDSTETATKWYNSYLLAGNLKKYQTLIMGNNYNHQNNNKMSIKAMYENFNSDLTITSGEILSIHTFSLAEISR